MNRRRVQLFTSIFEPTAFRCFSQVQAVEICTQTQTEVEVEQRRRNKNETSQSRTTMEEETARHHSCRPKAAHWKCENVLALLSWRMNE